MSITTPQERQAQSSAGLRDRLFATLDAVIAGDIQKEQVEAVCFISQEILKSAKVDLEFEEKAMRKIELQHKLEMEKKDSIKMLTETFIEVTDDD